MKKIQCFAHDYVVEIMEQDAQAPGDTPGDWLSEDEADSIDDS